MTYEELPEKARQPFRRLPLGYLFDLAALFLLLQGELTLDVRTGIVECEIEATESRDH